MATSPPTIARERDAALDGLRGVAILLVLLAHMQLPPGGLPLDHAVYSARIAGSTGVDLFFVLSGFLITGVLLDALGDQHYFRNFYARRALRTLPLYYGAVLFLLFVWPLITPDGPAPLAALRKEQWWYWLHATNVLSVLPGPWRSPYNTGHFWSLAVEEQFYAVWPVVVLVCARRQWLMRVCAACVMTAFALRLALALGGVSEKWIHQLPVTRMDTLAIGAALAVLARRPGGLAAYVVSARRVLNVAAPVFAVLFAIYMTWHRAGPLFLSVGYSAAALAFGALLVVADGPLRGPFSHPLLRFFGKYSYGIYIIHFPLLPVIDWVAESAYATPTLWGSALPGQVVFFAGGLAISTVPAVVLWYAYERPFLSLKRFFPRVSTARTARPRLLRPCCTPQAPGTHAPESG